MAEEKSAPKAWTDAEKMEIFVQLVEKVGTIPWDELTLPEGRTKKACTVMVDREKQKVKKAREAAGGGDWKGGTPVSTPKGSKKRKGEGEGTAASTKKSGGGRKKAVRAGADDEAGEATGHEDVDVKAEVAEDV